MILTANSEVVRQTRRKTGNGWLTTFIGENRNTLKQGQTAPAAGVLYPMAFLVEKEPHAVTKPHFHEADQYQVIVQGGGRLGTHGVGTVAVHYTDAWSAYGPIVAADEGISWFTLRNTWDSGARYMPAARETVACGAGAEPPAPRGDRAADAGCLGRGTGAHRPAVLRLGHRADAGRHGDVALPAAGGRERQRSRSARRRRTVLDRAVRFRRGGRGGVIAAEFLCFCRTR